MRYSYGILDRRRILLYKPQLFLGDDDVLVFPTREFHKWHGNVKEYLDGLYQIHKMSGQVERPVSLDMNEFNLAVAVLNSITEELEQLFDSDNPANLSYHYVSNLDDRYKKMIGNSYTTDMKRCDTKIHLTPRITPWLKHQHKMEIVDQIAMDFAKTHRSKKFKKEEF